MKNIFSRHLQTPLLSLSILYQLLKPDRPSTKNPIAHPPKIRSHIHPKTRSHIHQKPDRTSTQKPDRTSTKNPIVHPQKTRSPIHKKPDRPSTKNPIAHPQKNPIAGPQKPGFFRNTSLQPTDVDKNLAVNCVALSGVVRFDLKGQLSTVNCLTPSNRRKCTRPDRSPATTVTPSGAIAQHSNPYSPLKLATSL